MLKNNMIKLLKKKALIIAFGVCCISMISCNNEDTDTYETSSITSIAAVVENGSAFDSRIDKVVVYTEDGYQVAIAAYENVRFIIDLPETIESSHLRRVFTYQPDLQVSNKNALGIGVRLYAYQSESRVGEFFYAKSTDKPTEALFVYVDRAVRITGRQSITWDNAQQNQGPTVFFTHINYHSISLKKGWNIIYFNETSTQQGRNSISTEEITTDTPEGLRWHFNGPGERTFQPKFHIPSFPIPNTMRVARPHSVF
jgi:hypothetical protein